MSQTYFQYQQQKIQPQPQSVQRSKIDCVIEPREGKGGIFIGAIEDASNVIGLQQQHIQYVLTLSWEQPIKYQQTDGVSQKVLQCRDLAWFDINEMFQQANEFIDGSRQNGNVLVHCMAGISRSACVILSYLMLKQNINLQQALTNLKAVRPMVRPNPGFLKQLLDLENSLYGGISSRLSQQITPYFGVQDEIRYKPTISPPNKQQYPNPIVQNPNPIVQNPNPIVQNQQQSNSQIDRQKTPTKGIQDGSRYQQQTTPLSIQRKPQSIDYQQTKSQIQQFHTPQQNLLKSEARISSRYELYENQKFRSQLDIPQKVDSLTKVSQTCFQDNNTSVITASSTKGSLKSQNTVRSAKSQNKYTSSINQDKESGISPFYHVPQKRHQVTFHTPQTQPSQKDFLSRNIMSSQKDLGQQNDSFNFNLADTKIQKIQSLNQNMLQDQQIRASTKEINRQSSHNQSPNLGFQGFVVPRSSVKTVAICNNYWNN